MTAERASVAASLLGLARASPELTGRRPCRAEVVSAPGDPLPDSAGKYLLLDQAGEPVAFGFESPSAAPGAVARDARNANRARALLGEELGRFVLTALAERELGGASIAIYPTCDALADGRLPWLLQRRAVQEWSLGWLRAVAARTVGAAAAGEGRWLLFERPLVHLAELSGLPAALRSDAIMALARIREGRWRPRPVLMHGDFWKGNIMVRRPAGPRTAVDGDFVVIDWGTSEADGYAIFDLIRVAQSLGTRPARLRLELSRHLEVLGCELLDTRGYLLAALGHRALNLEFFPLDRFVRMATSCHATIGQVT